MAKSTPEDALSQGGGGAANNAQGQPAPGAGGNAGAATGTGGAAGGSAGKAAAGSAGPVQLTGAELAEALAFEGAPGTGGGQAAAEEALGAEDVAGILEATPDIDAAGVLELARGALGLAVTLIATRRIGSAAAAELGKLKASEEGLLRLFAPAAVPYVRMLGIQGATGAGLFGAVCVWVLVDRMQSIKAAERAAAASPDA